MKKVFLLSIAVFMLLSISVSAQVLFQDDFESYANNAAVTAAYDSNTLNPGFSDNPTSPALPGVFHSMADFHTVANVLNDHFPAIKTSEEKLIVSYNLYDPAGTGPGATGSATLNGRAGLSIGAYTGGIWGSGTMQNYIFIGAYHGTSTSFYCGRVVTGGANWFATTAPRSVGWQKFTVELYKGTVKMYHNDGTTPVYVGPYTEPAGGFNCFRLGSPAGATYLNAYYDNLKFERVRPNSGCYAGLIRIDNSLLYSGIGGTISYVLPFAPSANPKIEILNASNAVVATFNGTALQGMNTVAWDGSVDNAGGADVAVGVGYKIRITVADERAEGFFVAASNGSTAPGTLFSGFSPNSSSAPSIQNSDNYGLIFTRSSYAPYSAHIQLRGDLQPLSGDGTADRVLNFPGTVSNGALWGGALLPNSETILASGQSSPQYVRGNLDDVNAVAATSGTVTLLGLPRANAVVDEGGQLWNYMTAGNSTVHKVKITSDGIITTNSVVVFNEASLGATLYAKDITFDSNKNMYWLHRNGTTANGRLLRFDAAKVQAIVSTMSTPLTLADASWDITFDSGLVQKQAVGVAISDGIVYVSATNASTESSAAIYKVAPAATATLVKTLTAADIMINGGNWADGVYGDLDTDPVGNLIIGNRSPETITLFSPGGKTEIVTNAPSSQTFSIVPEPVLDYQITSGTGVLALGDAALTQQVSAIDLIEGRMPDVITGGFHSAYTGTAAPITNGVFDADGLTVLANDYGQANPSVAFTYNLNNATIDKVIAFAGHGDSGSRAFIHADVEFNFDGTWVLMGTIQTGAFGTAFAGTEMVSYAAISGAPISVLVDGVRISFYGVSNDFNPSAGFAAPGANAINGTLIKEIDVFGSHATSVTDWELIN